MSIRLPDLFHSLWPAASRNCGNPFDRLKKRIDDLREDLQDLRSVVSTLQEILGQPRAAARLGPESSTFGYLAFCFFLMVALITPSSAWI